MKQEKFLMRVNNDKEGRNFIHSLKRNLNSNSYRIVTRYTGPRPVGTNQVSTSRENAKSLRLYVESKFPEQDTKNNWEVRQAKVEGENGILHEQLKIKKLEEEKKVLEAKLTLLTSGLQNSSKYGTFVKTVNSIDSIGNRRGN